MAELLQASDLSASIKVPPIFPGKHCNPLSPNPRDPLTRPKTELGRIDDDHQLAKIFAVLGPPSAGEVERLGGESQLTDCARRLTERVSPRARGAPPPEPRFPTLLAKAPRDALDVVVQTLRFDHRKRASLASILAMPFFSRPGAVPGAVPGASGGGAAAADSKRNHPSNIARRLMELAMVEPPLSPVDLSYVESVNVERSAPRAVLLESRKTLHARILDEARLVAAQQEEQQQQLQQLLRQQQQRRSQAK